MENRSKTRKLSLIKSLVIPPAWENVWIAPSRYGHLQAVGRDARGREQYRYHSLYRPVHDATKFTRMIAFSEALPAIRARVEKDLAPPGLPRNKVLAAVVKLLDRTCVRVGNEEYVREYCSFGLTTLRNKHVKIEGRTLHFRFKGKSGVIQDTGLTERRLAKIVRDCQCIPGQGFPHLERHRRRLNWKRSGPPRSQLRSSSPRIRQSGSWRQERSGPLEENSLKKIAITADNYPATG